MSRNVIEFLPICKYTALRSILVFVAEFPLEYGKSACSQSRLSTRYKGQYWLLVVDSKHTGPAPKWSVDPPAVCARVQLPDEGARIKLEPLPTLSAITRAKDSRGRKRKAPPAAKF